MKHNFWIITLKFLNFFHYQSLINLKEKAGHCPKSMGLGQTYGNY